jgi:hypothetical protein
VETCTDNMKKTITYILLCAGFLLFPAFSYAQECTARIVKTDTYDSGSVTYPENQIQILNAGIENADTLRLESEQFSSEHLVCPLGFTANSSNPHAVTCSISSRHLVLNELNKITIAYSGAGGSYGNITTGVRYPTSNGSANRDNWTDPGKLYVADNDYGYVDVFYPNPEFTGQSYSGFGSFNIPENATITAISIETKGYTSNTSAGRQLVLRLTRDEFTTSQNNSANNDLMWLNPQSFIGQDHTYTTDSGATNFVSYNWTPDDFNSGNFALEIFANDNTNTRFSVDYLRVKVTYRVLDTGCFRAFINSTECSEALGTLCPSPDTGGIVVPKTCDSLDIFCKFQQWFYGAFTYWFGFDEEFSQDQFHALQTWLNYKFPFGYLAPLQASGFGSPLGSPSATLQDINISFTPKIYHNGIPTDLDPVELSVAKSTFAPIEPFLGYIRGFFTVIIFISLGLFIIYNAGRFFS